MKSVIVGTAGHIDHGKTALVRALTGIDTDRLEEEKRRGITIDLGFAHLALKGPGGEDLRLGFVDVPGHERFVRNMLAGVGGIDIVLLIVAADEGVMPQTREHFDICRMLGVQRGLTVLTKSDLVDADTLEVVRLEVEEFVRGSFLDASRAPIVPVSAITGAGLDEFRRELARIAEATPGKSTAGAVRLPIDRAFTMKGFGTVVTGTLLTGKIRKEDELELLPAGKTVRVRGVQVHGRAADEATAGQRTALNLAGVELEDLARGMMLVAPHGYRSIQRADVSLTLLPDAKPLRNHARVHLHTHTSETIAEIVLARAGSEPEPLQPGTTTLVRMRFAEPLPIVPGDRLIVRQFSPVITIGGGTVVDAAPLSRRFDERAVEWLRRVESAVPSDVAVARVSRRGPDGLTAQKLVEETGWTPQQARTVLADLAKANGVVACGTAYVTPQVFAESKAGAVRTLDAFHKANPLVAGIGKEELRNKLELNPDGFAAVLTSLISEKKVQVAGEQVSLAGRGVTMKSDEADSKREIEQAFARAGLKVPALKDVLAGLKVDRTRAQQIVTLLLRDKTLVKLADDLVFHRDALDQLRQQITALKTSSPKIDVSRFKDLTGVSRKYAIPLLEYLDRERVTRRVGDERIIV